MTSTDTGENVQKWTRVFSTRRWVILVAESYSSLSHTRRAKPVNFPKNRIHEILHIPDLWTKADLLTIFWAMKNQQIGGCVFPNSFSTDISVPSFIFVPFFFKSRRKCRNFFYVQTLMQPFSLYDFSQIGLKTFPNSLAFSALQENLTTKPTLPGCVEVLQKSANSAADFIFLIFFLLLLQK